MARKVTRGELVTHDSCSRQSHSIRKRTQLSTLTYSPRRRGSSCAVHGPELNIHVTQICVTLGDDVGNLHVIFCFTLTSNDHPLEGGRLLMIKNNMSFFTVNLITDIIWKIPFYRCKVEVFVWVFFFH